MKSTSYSGPSIHVLVFLVKKVAPLYYYDDDDDKSIIDKVNVRPLLQLKTVASLLKICSVKLFRFQLTTE